MYNIALLDIHFNSDSNPSQDTNTLVSRHQVKNACIHCQKACKKCDNGRPCQRCIKYNLSDTCRNSERKKRQKGIKRGPYNRHRSSRNQATICSSETNSIGVTKQRQDDTQRTEVPPNHAVKQVTLPTSSCSTNIVDVLSFEQRVDFASSLQSYPLPYEHNHLLLLTLKEYHDHLFQQQNYSSTGQHYHSSRMNSQGHDNHY
ncbi:hypothetical protein BD560DRAFT_417530 [Blakeslea trispora]|nr:hypothetical protein BD560DRAFT_417530 [Blakeslea trispora]